MHDQQGCFFLLPLPGRGRFVPGCRQCRPVHPGGRGGRSRPDRPGVRRIGVLAGAGLRAVRLPLLARERHLVPHQQRTARCRPAAPGTGVRQAAPDSGSSCPRRLAGAVAVVERRSKSAQALVIQHTGWWHFEVTNPDTVASLLPLVRQPLSGQRALHRGNRVRRRRADPQPRLGILAENRPQPLEPPNRRCVSPPWIVR
jgi:hypothetical protein